MLQPPFVLVEAASSVPVRQPPLVPVTAAVLALFEGSEAAGAGSEALGLSCSAGSLVMSQVLPEPTVVPHVAGPPQPGEFARRGEPKPHAEAVRFAAGDEAEFCCCIQGTLVLALEFQLFQSFQSLPHDAFFESFFAFHIPLPDSEARRSPKEGWRLDQPLSFEDGSVKFRFPP